MPRSWLVPAVALVLVLAAAGLWWTRSRPARPGAVVLVSIDTLRADRLPLYGYAKGRTPALDALASDSVLFEKAYAHAPQTLPSHASMFTGRLPFEHKVRDNLGFTLADGAVTLASLFKSAGYRTAGFVSAYVLRRETGVAQGFDVYNAEFPPTAADRSPGQVQRAGAETLAAATRWLETFADPRVFLFFHIYEPHKPYAPPARFAGMDAYDGEVAYADEIVGQLVDSLKRKGWYDDATIVVMSDHGEGLGDHGEQEHGLFVYDEVIRVPWIMKLHGGRGAGRRIPAPIQHIDLLPTLAAIAGVTPPDGLRGRSLLPAALGAGTLAPQGVYSEALYPRYHFGWSELLALTDERYRYIKAPREELYDLERDPEERVNLMADRPQAAAALRSGLESLVAGRGLDAPSAVSAEDRERLAALGYIGASSAPRDGEAASLPDPKDKADVLRKYREAIDRIGQGGLEEGARLLSEILRTDPQMTDVWSQQAAVLTRLGRHEEAFRAYQQVIRLNPEEPSGALGAASALVSLGRLDDAAAHGRLAVARAPAAAHQALANIAVTQRRFDVALREAELAQKADPTLPLPAFIRGLIAYNQERFADALPHFMEAREGYAKRALQTADLHFFIGDSLARMDRYREAEPFLREEIRLYPNNVRARAGLAMLCQAMGRPGDAARAIDELLAVSPSPAAYATAARLWRMFGEPQRAAAVESAARQKFRR
jgi:arylsulfatase A-like enzyme/Flp pilus assembly protein TadD